MLLKVEEGSGFCIHQRRNEDLGQKSGRNAVRSRTMERDDEVHTVLAGLGAKDKYVRRSNVQSRPGSDAMLLNRRARMF